MCKQWVKIVIHCLSNHQLKKHIDCLLNMMVINEYYLVTLFGYILFGTNPEF